MAKGNGADPSGGPAKGSKDLSGVPKRRALVVGINDYNDPRNNLNSCIADAESFAQLLRDGYGFEEIRQLHDGEATLSQVRAGLDWLFTGATGDDRLVYFQSSHGHHLQDGDSIEEVLVVRGDTADQPYAFLHDDELSSRTQDLPPSVLTVVLDACYSGGMDKLLFTDDSISSARTKVWLPSPDAAPGKQFAPGELSFKIFGRAPIRSSGALARLWNLPEPDRKAFEAAKDLDEAGQVELNGLLMAACQEDETAAAGTARTNNLSAFTYALLGAIDRLGTDSSAQDLCDEAARMLQDLHMRQTPLVAPPPRPAGLQTRSFITFAAGDHKDFRPDGSAGDIYTQIEAAIARAFAHK